MKSYGDELQILIDKVEGLDEKNWEELVDELHLDIHPDSLRKSFNGGRYSGYNVAKYYQDKFENDYCSSEEIDRLNSLKDEVYKEKCKLADKKREHNKWLREEARFENLLDVLKESLNDLPELTKSNVKPLYGGSSEASLLLSDIHYGALVSNTLNEYNCDIAEKRLNALCDKVIQECIYSKVETLYLCLLGDMINGNIHISANVESEEDVISQVIKVSELISHFVMKLNDYIPNIVIYGVCGNHARITRNKDESRTVENFERLMFHYITLRTGMQVRTNGLEDWINFKTKSGKSVYMSHGDKDSFSNAKTHAINMTGEVPNYIYLGHVHHMMVNDENGTETIINGSIMSTDSYAMSIRCHTEPYQILHVFDSNSEHIAKLFVD